MYGLVWIREASTISESSPEATGEPQAGPARPPRGPSGEFQLDPNKAPSQDARCILIWGCLGVHLVTCGGLPGSFLKPARSRREARVTESSLIGLPTKNLIATFKSARIQDARCFLALGRVGVHLVPSWSPPGGLPGARMPPPSSPLRAHKGTPEGTRHQGGSK